MTRAPDSARRSPLNRERVLLAAVALADRIGIEALSMRGLAQELGVVPMALYKHVANKDELLDGMVEVIVGEIVRPEADGDWRAGVRGRILSARAALLRHPWAARAIESRSRPTPAVLGYLDSVIGAFRTGGVSADLTHHAMHALGSRVWGFTQELFPAPPGDAGLDPEPMAAQLQQLAAHFPHLVEIVAARSHDPGSTVGGGCDDQFEFEFALDVLLDGFERLHRRGWTSTH
ncbi:TetR/AcrR family transcriptional regulator C-terminal domain-containing protein [Streptomyces sp. TLI_171]|uniref:TetR/AcrR family transcriptional regulator C-terminal domain-containing protein n=1 Tax=Streptomyces sp. TLI_171 TaxID=1938859 RepID=UPI000C1799BD|nr:TetR/AcrR family transcriptional regulator C-terminal domain-containing protein [Streptomyces sp. TLI_171]RKE17722.1 TetR family transcriptional regulator [Streptomyces sp. TLI_171]